MARLLRFQDGAGARWGALDADGSVVRRVEGSVYHDWQPGAAVGPSENLILLPPCEPITVAALAYNYKDLVGVRDRYDEPLVFLKSTACVIGPDAPIRRPSWTDRVWVEVELAIVVGAPLFNASREEARAGILGVTVANDVTAVNIHGRDHHLARSKSLDTFCPVGHVLQTEIDTSALAMKTSINGRLTQNGTTRNRILDDVESLMLVSRLFPLQPGDLVLTGTPAGAMDSLVVAGDDVRLEIEGLGGLRNPIHRRH